MQHVPASVQNKIEARMQVMQRLYDSLSPLIKQMSGIDLRVVRADITDEELEKYEAVHYAKYCDTHYMGQSIEQLFDFIDDSPADAVALFKGTRHIC